MRKAFPTIVLGLLALSPAARAGAPDDGTLVVPDESGGGEYVFQDADHLTEERRAEIWAVLHANIRKLRDERVLPERITAHPVLGWPLRPAAGLTDPGYHGIGNFVDQNPGYPNQLLDYNCGSRTYDRDFGYNHQGIDFLTWPFPWRKMDAGEVEIVAAAAGHIIGKEDGNYDRNCVWNNEPWNAVYIEHPDGSVAWYGHMKNGSPTTKPVGAAVAQGEYLGVVGSSGSSSIPHLHMEIYDSSGALNEAYQGPCNGMNSDSWWSSQRPYYDSAVNRLATGFNAPIPFPPCPNPESPNEATFFPFGTRVYFVAYYRDQLNTQLSQYRVYQPNGSLYSSWNGFSTEPHYPMSYWYWSIGNFAVSGPAGVWRFEVTYEGQTYTHNFTIGPAPASGRVPDTSLRIARGAGSDLELSWAASCAAGDLDYGVYEGPLDFSFGLNHTAILCSTDGATTAVITPADDSTYYLVVPANAHREGSYGRASSGAERPVGGIGCKLQLVGGCP